MSKKWMLTKPLKCGCCVEMGKIIEPVATTDLRTQLQRYGMFLSDNVCIAVCLHCNKTISLPDTEKMFETKSDGVVFCYPFTPLDGDEMELRQELIDELHDEFFQRKPQFVGRHGQGNEKFILDHDPDYKPDTKKRWTL